MNHIEKQIARRLAADLIAAGHKVSVDYERGWGCEEQNRDLTDPDKIVTASDAVDECHWMLDALHDERECSATAGYVYLIWGNGNDGRDCISDYTTNLAPIVDPISDWADTAGIALLGEPARKTLPELLLIESALVGAYGEPQEGASMQSAQGVEAIARVRAMIADAEQKGGEA